MTEGSEWRWSRNWKPGAAWRNNGYCGKERRLARVQEEMENYAGFNSCLFSGPTDGRRGDPFNFRHGDQVGNKGHIASTED